TLRAQLEASIWREDDARAAATAAAPAPATAIASPGEGQAKPELDSKERGPGFGARLVPFRDWDDYVQAIEAAVRQLEQSSGGAGQVRGPDHHDLGHDASRRE